MTQRPNERQVASETCGKAGSVSLEAPLLDILACPIDKGGLLYFADEGLLYNPRLRRIYRVSHGLPVMVAARAETAGPEEHERLAGLAERGSAVGTAGLAVDRCDIWPTPAGPLPDVAAPVRLSNITIIGAQSLPGHVQKASDT